MANLQINQICLAFPTQINDAFYLAENKVPFSIISHFALEIFADKNHFGFEMHALQYRILISYDIRFISEKLF